MRNHAEVFETIYKRERWGKGKGSGTGSDPDYCREYLNFIETVIPFRARVMDIGCGDHQLYQGFDLGQWRYLGCDASDTALQLASDRYPEGKKPVLIRAYRTEDLAELILRFDPEYILIKDVLMHWEDEEIEAFFEELTPIIHGTIVTAHNHRYFRKPCMNGKPRKLDRYSWAPIAEDHHVMVKYGFNPVKYYPRGGFKLISIRRPPSEGVDVVRA